MLLNINQSSSFSVIELVQELIEQSYNLNASDIHLDPKEKFLLVRLRIDGILYDASQLEKSMHQEIISRIKILASMRIDEHQTAQDGRFRLKLKNQLDLDIRASVMPTYYGENVVLRLLSDKAEQFNLESLGLAKESYAKVLSAINRPYGLVLVSGPTGSGKTTTLYSLLKHLNKQEVCIVTIEDPIEYAIAGVRQIPVNNRTGLSFAQGLRSILRQDPDIIMVGEIRDNETAAIAVNAALTGHLVLSTLHANSAAATLPRLIDMKIEPYLITSTVNLVIGQRLIRKVCSNCKTTVALSNIEFKSVKEKLPLVTKNSRFYKGQGCESCHGYGHLGRISIHEVLVPNNDIKEAVLRKAPAHEIHSLAAEKGMYSLTENATEKMQQGLTSLDEVLRILYE